MDEERIYVEVLGKTGRRILKGNIKHIGRFGVVQDFTITLDNGQEIYIAQDAVDIIAKEWNRLQKDNAIL